MMLLHLSQSDAINAVVGSSWTAHVGHALYVRERTSMALVGNRKDNYTPADDYYTPKWIFDSLRLEFSLDVCAPLNGVPWLPARNHYSIENDGLIQEWFGRVWMNPPYSKPAPWIDRFLAHGNGVALVQTSKSNGFIQLWNQADAIMYLPRNFTFEHRDHGTKGIFMPVALFAMGESNVQALKASGINKVR